MQLGLEYALYDYTCKTFWRQIMQLGQLPLALICDALWRPVQFSLFYIVGFTICTHMTSLTLDLTLDLEKLLKYRRKKTFTRKKWKNHSRQQQRRIPLQDGQKQEMPGDQKESSQSYINTFNEYDSVWIVYDALGRSRQSPPHPRSAERFLYQVITYVPSSQEVRFSQSNHSVDIMTHVWLPSDEQRVTITTVLTIPVFHDKGLRPAAPHDSQSERKHPAGVNLDSQFDATRWRVKHCCCQQGNTLSRRD